LTASLNITRSVGELWFVNSEMCSVIGKSKILKLIFFSRKHENIANKGATMMQNYPPNILKATNYSHGMSLPVDLDHTMHTMIEVSSF
jgi:hypothetical protein